MVQGNKRRICWILLAVILFYLLMGVIFTILRSNAHYNYFIIKEDSLENNGNSYWENRCTESNRANSIPMAQWCVDGSGNFHTDKPSKLSWYFYFYSKKPVDFLVTIMLWWNHFIGTDMINFRGVSYGY